MDVDPRPVGELELPGDDRTFVQLRERAFAAMERAYAPYSKFRVGAALLASDGSITEGCPCTSSSIVEAIRPRPMMPTRYLATCLLLVVAETRDSKSRADRTKPFQGYP